MRNHKKALVITASVISFLVAGLVLAQPQGGQGGQRGQRGQGDRNPEEMRQMFEQRMAERMKEQLEITDAEWKVLQPRFQKVTELQRQTAGGGRGGMMGMMMMGGRGGRGGQDGQQRGPRPDSNQAQSEVQQATEALRVTLEKGNPSPEELKAGLTKLRSVREKAQQELLKAQGELRQLLTLKQEATLCMMGILP
jgi:hypothetical protein